jgi:hypothetical protein
MNKVPKKARLNKHCNLSKKHGVTYTMHATKDCHKYEKDGSLKDKFCSSKKASKKPNLAKQSFAKLTKKLEKLEKTLQKVSLKSKKWRRENSDSDSEYGIGLDSTRDIGLNLGENIKWTKFTPPSPIEVTHTQITSNQDVVCPTSFSDTGDGLLMSPSQREEVHVSYSILPNKDPSDGKTAAVIAMMKGKPKNDYHHCSNKHCKQKLVQVLLDSGSDGNLVFVNKDKPMLLPYSKRLVPSR